MYISINWHLLWWAVINGDAQDEIACSMIGLGLAEIRNGHNHFEQIL